MRISHQYKFIYYSIPKTASESVRILLNPISDVKIVKYSQVNQRCPFYSHMRPHEVKSTFNALDINIDEYFSFATVRNPWKRMASLYCMIQNNKLPGYNCSFKQWLMSINPENLIYPPTRRKWFDHGLLNYNAFLYNDDKEASIDKVFRIEDGLSDLINHLKHKIGLHDWEPQIPFINKNTSEFYDTQSINIVGKLFLNDIKKYSYSFDT